MTEIFIDMRQLTGVEPDDALGPHRGRFKIYPFALLYRADHFVTKQALSILIDGTGSVFLPPTLAAEGMVFDPVGIPGLGRKIFAIPDSPTAINFVDLVELDPATLDQTPDVVAAWQAALDAFDTRLTAAEGEIDALQVATITELRALTGLVDGQAVRVTTTGRGGLFRFVSADNSANVTADPQQGVYVPPDSDPTGASGSWVRQYGQAVNSSPPLRAEWFGLIDDPTINQTPEVDGLLGFAKANGYKTLEFPGVSCSAQIIIDDSDLDITFESGFLNFAAVGGQYQYRILETSRNIKSWGGEFNGQLYSDFQLGNGVGGSTQCVRIEGQGHTISGWEAYGSRNDSLNISSATFPSNITCEDFYAGDTNRSPCSLTGGSNIRLRRGTFENGEGYDTRLYLWDHEPFSLSKPCYDVVVEDVDFICGTTQADARNIFVSDPFTGDTRVDVRFVNCRAKAAGGGNVPVIVPRLDNGGGAPLDMFGLHVDGWQTESGVLLVATVNKQVVFEDSSFKNIEFETDGGFQIGGHIFGDTSLIDNISYHSGDPSAANIFNTGYYPTVENYQGIGAFSGELSLRTRRVDLDSGVAKSVAQIDGNAGAAPGYFAQVFIRGYAVTQAQGNASTGGGIGFTASFNMVQRDTGLIANTAVKYTEENAMRLTDDYVDSVSISVSKSGSLLDIVVTATTGGVVGSEVNLRCDLDIQVLHSGSVKPVLRAL